MCFVFSIHTDSFNYLVTSQVQTQTTAATCTGCIIIGCYCAGSTSICTNGQVASMSKLFVLVLNNVILCAYKYLSAQKQCNRTDK